MRIIKAFFLWIKAFLCRWINSLNICFQLFVFKKTTAIFVKPITVNLIN